jgi:hypothetical protein
MTNAVVQQHKRDPCPCGKVTEKRLMAELGYCRYHLDELGAGHDPGFVETKFTDEGNRPERTVDLNCDMK